MEHDVLKALYESVISAEQRKDLGEYCTPDWLAERVVQEVVTDPANQRVLDPACGSGTFLFQRPVGVGEVLSLSEVSAPHGQEREESASRLAAMPQRGAHEHVRRPDRQ